MAQSTTDHSPGKASTSGATPREVPLEWPRPIGVCFALALYLLVQMTHNSDMLARTWPPPLLPLATCALLFPTTYGGLLALFILGAAAVLHWHTGRRALRACPDIRRSHRGVSRAGLLSWTHVPIGWSIVWRSQLVFLLLSFVCYAAAHLAYPIPKLLLVLAPMALTVAVMRHCVRHFYAVPLTGLAWPFLWRCLLTGVLIEMPLLWWSSLHDHQIPLYLGGAIHVVRTALQSFATGWAAHRAVIVRDRAQPEPAASSPSNAA